jgi:hypothetical protein
MHQVSEGSFVVPFIVCTNTRTTLSPKYLP